jgi:hypothetical protein
LDTAIAIGLKWNAEKLLSLFLFEDSDLVFKQFALNETLLLMLKTLEFNMLWKIVDIRERIKHIADMSAAGIFNILGILLPNLTA